MRAMRLRCSTGELKLADKNQAENKVRGVEIIPVGAALAPVIRSIGHLQSITI